MKSLINTTSTSEIKLTFGDIYFPRITSNFSHYIYTCAETNGRNFWIQLSAHPQLLRLLPMTSVITGTLDV